MNTCPSCGSPMPLLTHAGTPRRACSISCGARLVAAERKRVALERIEDVEFMLDSGSSPEMVAARLHTTTASLARAMYRAGRNDLGALFDRAMRRERRAA